MLGTSEETESRSGQVCLSYYFWLTIPSYWQQGQMCVSFLIEVTVRLLLYLSIENAIYQNIYFFLGGTL